LSRSGFGVESTVTTVTVTKDTGYKGTGYTMPVRLWCSVQCAVCSVRCAVCDMCIVCVKVLQFQHTLLCTIYLLCTMSYDMQYVVHTLSTLHSSLHTVPLYHSTHSTHSSPDQLTGAAVSSLFLPILTPPSTLK
jgi:hypothetical protein